MVTGGLSEIQGEVGSEKFLAASGPAYFSTRNSRAVVKHMRIGGELTDRAGGRPKFFQFHRGEDLARARLESSAGSRR
jgi:hypothetical protein